MQKAGQSKTTSLQKWQNDKCCLLFLLPIWIFFFISCLLTHDFPTNDISQKQHFCSKLQVCLKYKENDKTFSSFVILMQMIFAIFFQNVTWLYTASFFIISEECSDITLPFLQFLIQILLSFLFFQMDANKGQRVKSTLLFHP